MHTEEYEEYEDRGFPFRNFLLKLILIIIFVFLLVWLLPKFITPKIVENNNSNKEITAISSQIFIDNLNRMKEAAISYYTDERLPKEEGESHTMTLSEMIGNKIIAPLIDKNNKACDVENSYVKITKAANEYILKVNLKDSEKEDYILVHLGCYTYCDTYICEKKNTDVIIKGSIKDNVITKPKDETQKTPEQNDEESKEPTPEKTYIYEYQRTTGIELSKWSSWSAWSKTDCNTKEINCTDNDTGCLKKLQLYSRKEKIGTYDKKYVSTHSELVQTGSYPVTKCTGYNYAIINNTTYKTTSTYSVVTSIKASTQSTRSDWRYDGRASYKNPPSDTSTTHYEFVGADYSYCEETCETLPNYFYDKYTYVGTLTQKNIIPGSSSTTSSTNTIVEASCNSYETTTIPIYGTIQVSEISSRVEPLYGTICYQSTKTRKITNSGKTEYKWSIHNDTNLLNNGWSYTGSKKVAS